MLAIIGGSGLTTLANLSVSRKVVATTAWGDPSSPITIGEIAGRSVMFLARHGPGHTIPPHKINYRANILALKNAGATQIVAVAAVGGIHPDCTPGSLVVPEQIVDYTSGRAHTYFDGQDKHVVHIDFTWPYSRMLRDRLIAAALKANVKIVGSGVYGATNGPRLETAAEIIRMERDGCTLVGMTGMPEAALAREQDVAYTSLAVVANWAAGKGDSSQAISLEMIRATLDESMEQARRVIEQMVQANP
jgi:5'-deoxy-5'-methylthioadenosine phosphorylase